MRTHLLLLITAMLFSTATVFAQGGTTGPLTWNISNGTLTINGEGDMPNYSNVGSAYAPWYQYRESINTVDIKVGVTSIGDCAFSDCTNLSSIIIPNGVKRIGVYAFDYCKNMTSITLPNSVIWIEALAFAACTGLDSIKIPENVISIGDDAFGTCTGLISVIIPNSVTNIGRGAFSGCASLISIAIPDGVKNIGSLAFAACTNLTSATISKSVSNIGTGAFAGCTTLLSIDVESENNSYASEDGVLFNKSKTTLLHYPAGKKTDTYVIPNSVTWIGQDAFRHCTNLTSAIISNSITSIEDFTFDGCTSLASVIIPNGVTRIGSTAFCGCTSLTSVTIPNSVKKIESWAFGYCKNLTLITNLNPVPVDIHFSVFEGVYKSACTLEVPISSVSAYKNVPIWKEFNIVGIEVGIETIELEAIKIYPNPTTGELRIEVADQVCNDGELGIKIFDAYGKVLHSHTALMSPKNTLDISHLPTGIYFVKISTATGEVVKKIAKK